MNNENLQEVINRQNSLIEDLENRSRLAEHQLDKVIDIVATACNKPKLIVKQDVGSIVLLELTTLKDKVRNLTHELNHERSKNTDVL